MGSGISCFPRKSLANAMLDRLQTHRVTITIDGPSLEGALAIVSASMDGSIAV